MGSFAEYTKAERNIVRYYDRKLRRAQRREQIMRIVKWWKNRKASILDNLVALTMFIGIMLFHGAMLQLCYGSEARIPAPNPVEQAIEHWTYPNYLYDSDVIIPCDTDMECEELNPYVYDWDEVIVD